MRIGYLQCGLSIDVIGMAVCMDDHIRCLIAHRKTCDPSILLCYGMFGINERHSVVPLGAETPPSPVASFLFIHVSKC